MESNSNKSRNGRKHSFLQKHKVNFEKSKNWKNVHSNESEKKGFDDRNSESIVIAEFRVSDNRRRDVDGMVATILDCIVRANILKDDCIGQVDSIIAHASKVGKSNTGFTVVLIEKVD